MINNLNTVATSGKLGNMQLFGIINKSTNSLPTEIRFIFSHNTLLTEILIYTILPLLEREGVKHLCV